ncbi:LOW QUALITY PROTEIN: serum response factor-binding protein 1-like [Fundulus heteroclitus]|uniref:LOW QUALITY PROTEIN: serum response factor-binding protein 1-like n=1 Tax=Fundulus heteroclitus TaxID=8078 RepID=UPI00165A5A91|nr:LOW QUALITY PROTEIN: serum response factor-binding protein 1-like [Fundulus heteroclitus]
MINTKETIMPSVEEKEMEEEEEEEDEEEEENDEEEDATSSDDDVEEEDEEGAGEKEAEPSSQAAKEGTPLSAEETQKPSDVLNLNNEVVKMRKEVKRVKALIIRKLTRQIAALKKKKGNEAETERNQRRAARLLEEVHSMKKLPPDSVTKTALQKNLNFDQVCKDPKSTISDRAVARITSHPQFRKKIESIKAAVAAFKEEHMKGGKRGGDPKGQRQPEKATRPSPDTRRDGKRQEKERDSAVNTQIQDDEERAAAVPKGGKTSGKEENVTRPPATPDVHRRVKAESPRDESALVQSSGANSSTTPKPQSKVQEKSPSLESAPQLVPKSADEEESDVESSDDEEKEYFDDSTEERFHKQSSQSEESDEDDFFIGKVSKFKKKKKQTSGEGEEKPDNAQEGKKDSGNAKTDKLQSELDELESRLKSKALTAQSLFCASLAGGKGGRGGDKGRGGGKSGRGFSKLDRFTKQDNRTSDSGSKFSKPLPEGRRPGSDRTEWGSAGGGRGKDVRKQKERRGGGFSSHQPPQPALHPSWEASKKRKEQQGQILAFQGKKIKFDDDD